MKYRITDRILSVWMIVCIAVFMLSFSIAFTVLFRPFYYAQISVLDIPENTGYNKDTIKTAYNEMLDFCIGKTDIFSTGELKYSEEGKGHFEDCRGLFILDFAALGISVFSIILLWALDKKAAVKLIKFRNRNLSYHASVSLLSVFAVITVLVSLNFDKAFELFHKIFFPGKDNWIFDPRYDEIIRILPEQFFANCAIMIVSIILVFSVVFIVKGVRTNKKSGKL